MVVKLGYGVADLMYYHFLRPRLGLDYGLHTLNVDVDVLEMEKYVKNNKIILVYVEHGSSNVDSSIFVTPKKGVAIAVDNHLRKAPIELIIPTSYVEGPIVVKSVDEHFEDLDEILDVLVSMNNFSFTANPKHDLSICVVEVQEHDIDVIDYDSYGSDLDGRIDSERRIQLREEELGNIQLKLEES
nr:hypothetical protein [Tanacetum cinerariifolium]